MGLQIDWYNQIIEITSPDTSLSLQVAHDFIEDEMATPRGLAESDIIQPEGKIEDPNQPGIYSQIIIVLNSPWQFQFWGGSGYTRIYGGKLVGGLNDQPFKATGTAGDITVLESPVDGVTVVTGSVLTPTQSAQLASASVNAQMIADIERGKWEIVGNQMICYKPDNITEIMRFNLFDMGGNPSMTDVMKRVKV